MYYFRPALASSVPQRQGYSSIARLILPKLQDIRDLGVPRWYIS